MSLGRHAGGSRRGWQRSVWAAPVAIAIASAVGLTSALIGDGPWDAVSWLGLGIPLAICIRYGVRRRRPN